MGIVVAVVRSSVVVGVVVVGRGLAACLGRCGGVRDALLCWCAGLCVLVSVLSVLLSDWRGGEPL